MDSVEWDRFVDMSPQGTIFCYSDYLANIDRKAIRYYVCRGSEKKAGLALILSDCESMCVLDDLVIYNGLLFNEDPATKLVKKRSERYEIAEFVIQELDKKFSQIEMALAPQFEDIRPFLWHNYHSDDLSGKFAVDPRYTTYLSVEELASASDEEDTDIFRNLETIRQRNIREARKSGVTFARGNDIQIFIRFYAALLERQGETVPPEKLKRMEHLIDALLKNGRAVMYCATNASGAPGYITIFCMDKRRAYYLFGAGSPELQERYLGTIAFWEAFKDLAGKEGVKEIDLEGVNSPNRGWFKLSFGGDLRSYYQLYLSHAKLGLRI